MSGDRATSEWPPPDPTPSFNIGDIVELPNGDVATVKYLPFDGRIAVETPWEAAWKRYDPSSLTLLDDGGSP